MERVPYSNGGKNNQLIISHCSHRHPLGPPPPIEKIAYVALVLPRKRPLILCGPRHPLAILCPNPPL